MATGADTTAVALDANTEITSKDQVRSTANEIEAVSIEAISDATAKVEVASTAKPTTVDIIEEISTAAVTEKATGRTASPVQPTKASEKLNIAVDLPITAQATRDKEVVETTKAGTAAVTETITSLPLEVNVDTKVATDVSTGTAVAKTVVSTESITKTAIPLTTVAPAVETSEASAIPAAAEADLTTTTADVTIGVTIEVPVTTAVKVAEAVSTESLIDTTTAKVEHPSNARPTTDIVVEETSNAAITEKVTQSTVSPVKIEIDLQATAKATAETKVVETTKATIAATTETTPAVPVEVIDDAQVATEASTVTTEVKHEVYTESVTETTDPLTKAIPVAEPTKTSTTSMSREANTTPVAVDVTTDGKTVLTEPLINATIKVEVPSTAGPTTTTVFEKTSAAAVTEMVSKLTIVRLETTRATEEVNKTSKLLPTKDNRITLPEFGSVLDIIEECALSMQCLPGVMKVSVKKSSLEAVEFYRFDEINLIGGEDYCRPTFNGTDYIFNIPLYGCGTTRRYVNDAIIYSNMVVCVDSCFCYQ